MGAVLVPLVFGVVILVVAWVALRQITRRQQQQHAELTHDEATLLYQLPQHQDPAVVVAALGKEGYAATIEESQGGPVHVLIGTNDDASPDRERVRQVLAGTDQLNFEGDTARLPAPRFVDEQS
jgi:hypothetical protein